MSILWKVDYTPQQSEPRKTTKPSIAKLEDVFVIYPANYKINSKDRKHD
jgi:hypothetical protein